VNRFENLTARYYENDLDVGESGELRDLIDGSPDLLREFVITGVREEQLRAALRSSCALEDSLPAGGVRKRWRKLQVLGLAAAALVALSAATWITMTRGVEVEVVASRDLSVSNGSLSPEAGSRGRVRDLTIEKGLLNLRLANGVSIEVLAPARLRFIDPMHVRILSGKATVDVGLRGKGFIVDAPQTRVVDLGTRFGVDASAAGSTGVVVIEGSVELHSKEGRVDHLAEGEGVVVNASGTIGKLDQARFDPHSGQWSTGALDDGSSLIRSVRNNQKDQSVYHIVAGGLVEAVPAHHNRNARWVSLPERSIPEWLLGADLVLPVHAHRDRAALRVTVKVAPSTVLFVFQRRNQPPPQWLVDGFDPTGERIGKVSIEQHRENKPVAFDIWRRDMPEGGEVVLGPAARPGSIGAGTIHYGIAALPIGAAPRPALK
jgi:ferric-dicitrate binding protein FerR (iron transport regulator)